MRYIYGGVDSPVAMVQGSNTYYFHYNGHGDVVALTNSTGAVVAEYDYDAYGNFVSTPKEGSVVNSYRYAGYRYDSETGFYYLNARYYWPTVGRFISRDSFHGFENIPASINHYNYSNSNPIFYTDPDGKSSIAARSSTGWLAQGVLWVGTTVITGIGAIGVYLAKGGKSASKQYKKPKAGVSGKEGAKDVPSWAKGEKPYKGESGNDFAKRLLDKKYGPGKYSKGPTSEFNKIKKWGDRAFE